MNQTDTRTRLLEAGREILVERGLPATLDLRLAEVVESVGLSTGAAYNIWKSQTEFRQDLSLHLASSFQWADTTAVAQAIATLGPDTTMADWVDVVCEAYFPHFVANQSFFLVLHFWGVREPDPALRDAIIQGYETLHAEFEFLYTATIRRYGLEVVPPFTISDLTTMITASIEGLALRHRFQPDRIENNGQHLFNAMLQMIATVYLKPTNT